MNLHSTLLSLSLLLGLSISMPTFALESKEIQEDQNHLMVVSIDLAKDHLALYWKNPQTQKPFQHFENLARYLKLQNQELIFATNSGIYDQDHKPLGLHIEAETVLAPLNRVKPSNSQGNFSLMPNGVFAVYQNQGKLSARILDTDDYPDKLADKSHIYYATQSGPLLIKNGNLHPRFIKDSDSLKIRNAVCTTNDGGLHFVLTLKPSNFYNFSSVLKSTLHCSNALYLDGSLSQFYLNKKYYGAAFWDIRTYVGIWAVSKTIPPE